MNRTAATAQRGEKTDTAQLLGRIGMACYGLVHLVLAYLALQVAFGNGEQADQKGALQEIGSKAFGQVLLWVLALGLVLFGLWQFMMAAVGYTWVSGGKRTRKRIGAGARGVVVIALGFSAFKIAIGNGNGGRATRPSRSSRPSCSSSRSGRRWSSSPRRPCSASRSRPGSRASRRSSWKTST